MFWWWGKPGYPEETNGSTRTFSLWGKLCCKYRNATTFQIFGLFNITIVQYGLLSVGIPKQSHKGGYRITTDWGKQQEVTSRSSPWMLQQMSQCKHKQKGNTQVSSLSLSIHRPDQTLPSGGLISTTALSRAPQRRLCAQIKDTDAALTSPALKLSSHMSIRQAGYNNWQKDKNA